VIATVLHRGLIVMYWSKQEQLAFDIILLLLVGFQIATVSLYAQNSLNNGILLVATNVFLVVAIVPYAKWVWKISTYQKGFLQVIKHEIILMGLILLGILLAMLMRRMKMHT